MATYFGVHSEVAKRGRELVRLFREATGQPLTLTSGKRSRAKQADLYALYRRGEGLPAARPGTSAHEFGLALDYSTRRDLYPVMWRLARSLGFVTLGWHDPVHVEARNWRAAVRR